MTLQAKDFTDWRDIGIPILSYVPFGLLGFFFLFHMFRAKKLDVSNRIFVAFVALNMLQGGFSSFFFNSPQWSYGWLCASGAVLGLYALFVTTDSVLYYLYASYQMYIFLTLIGFNTIANFFGNFVDGIQQATCITYYGRVPTGNNGLYTSGDLQSCQDGYIRFLWILAILLQITSFLGVLLALHFARKEKDAVA